jgi:hypothetical protein
MPEHRLEKARATLPEGYQYGGDAERRRAFDALADRTKTVRMTVTSREQFAALVAGTLLAEPTEDNLWGI